MKQRFRITVGSEPGHEDLVGDLYFDDHIVLVLTQDMEGEGMHIEIFPAPDGGSWSFGVAEFEEAVTALKTRMRELRRTEADDNG